MSKRIFSIAVLAYNRDQRVRHCIELIQKWANEHSSIQVWWSEHIPLDILPLGEGVDDEQLRRAHLIISIGGDGTFLSAARIVSALQTPILGVHTGKTGFLTDYPVEKLNEALLQISQGTYRVRPRLMMDIECRGSEHRDDDVVLNELMISPSGKNRMINLRVEVDGQFLTDYWADALLVSTPTGSTAYNLSAGGPILYPTTEAFVITAVNPPSLSVRPLVIPANSSLLIREIEGKECELLLDGRIEKTMSAHTELILRRSPWSTHFIYSSEYGFVDALKDKLGWCGNFRNTRGTDGC